MTSTAARCDRIITMIDACLAEFEEATDRRPAPEPAVSRPSR
jgi:hypothetical protein